MRISVRIEETFFCCDESSFSIDVYWTWNQSMMFISLRLKRSNKVRVHDNIQCWCHSCTALKNHWATITNFFLNIQKLPSSNPISLIIRTSLSPVIKDKMYSSKQISKSFDPLIKEECIWPCQQRTQTSLLWSSCWQQNTDRSLSTSCHLCSIQPLSHYDCLQTNDSHEQNLLLVL